MSTAIGDPQAKLRGASPVRSYGLAVVSVAAALLLSFWLDIPPIFIPAILVTAWYGGIGPGLLAAVLSIVGSQLVLADSPFALRIATINHAAYFVVFSCTALFVSWVTATQRRSEHALRLAHDELSLRVRDLGLANEQLHGEIAERHRAEEALHQAHAELARVTRLTMLGEITASLAHEVNQPLAAVVMSGGACRRWLDAAPPNLDEARGAVRRIIEDANRASDVIRRVRTLLQREAPERSPLDVNGLVRETLALTRGELARRGVTVRTELDEALPRVVGDRVGLEQVLVNLVLNGADAMDEVEHGRRTLSIRSRDGGGGVAIEVHDRGRGIGPGDADRVFDAFYSTKPGGLGMGLSISRSIVEAHGGRLWATPGDGGGTVLHLTLPHDAGGAP
ncbi:MAG TPA: ATP-binding protein [Longimicrobium sp.]|jgi:C4-dicarboxylate-specific signal transduction histidine kinase|nr:ATP-binding protein [Longimicrobium sp.]